MSMSGLLARQSAERDRAQRLGLETGEQYAIDFVMIALHRKGWGYKRIKELFDLVQLISDSYAPALREGMEQDICQERMDAEIRAFVEGNQEFFPFRERYPWIKNAGYDKLPKRS